MDALTNVRSRTAILQVTITLLSNMSGNADGRATVCNTRGKGINVTSLVTTSQPKFVIVAVYGNMFIVTLRQLLNGSLDGLNTAGFAHLLGRVVCVAACTVPISRKRFRVEGNFDTPLLCNSDEEITSHPELITHRNSVTRANLELPLRGHDFSVDTADPDASIETGTI